MSLKHYESIPRIQDNTFLIGEMVTGYNKLDGQNFCVLYRPKHKIWGPCGSRTRTVDENDEQFGEAVRWFNNSGYKPILENIVANNRGKKQIFNGVDELTFDFEWYGPNSFAGKHQEGDNLRLALIDVFIKKRGYIEPRDFDGLFRDKGIELPDLIFYGILNMDLINMIIENDWTQEGCMFPNIKEGVVFKRTTLLPGQRRPSVKVKTKWWLNKLHSMYSEEECKLLE